MNDDAKKKIDESWKEGIEKEKSNPAQEAGFAPPEPDFNFFITTLALQASISLGAVENPASHQKEENLPQAKFMVDTLTMLQEKTKGNLGKEEVKLLDAILYELRMQYVEKTQRGP
jgi:hypothetical protein